MLSKIYSATLPRQVTKLKRGKEGKEGWKEGGRGEARGVASYWPKEFVCLRLHSAVFMAYARAFKEVCLSVCVCVSVQVRVSVCECVWVYVSVCECVCVTIKCLCVRVLIEALHSILCSPYPFICIYSRALIVPRVGVSQSLPNDCQLNWLPREINWIFTHFIVVLITAQRYIYRRRCRRRSRQFTVTAKS